MSRLTAERKKEIQEYPWYSETTAAAYDAIGELLGEIAMLEIEKFNMKQFFEEEMRHQARQHEIDKEKHGLLQSHSELFARKLQDGTD